MRQKTEQGVLMDYLTTLFEGHPSMWVYQSVLAALIGWLLFNALSQNHSPEDLAPFFDMYTIFVYAPLAMIVVRPAIIIFARRFAVPWWKNRDGVFSG